MLGKIILEEAYNLPKLANNAKRYASPAAAVKLESDMTDIKGRLREMDEQVSISFLFSGKNRRFEATARESRCRFYRSLLQDAKVCTYLPSYFHQNVHGLALM
jgi:hypothetical protein